MHGGDEAAPRPVEPGPLPRHAARAVTGGGPAAELELDRLVHTLRITRQNKLILTK